MNKTTIVTSDMECVLFPMAHLWERSGGKERECDSASRSRIDGDVLKQARGIIYFYQYQLNMQYNKGGGYSGVCYCLVNAVAVNLNEMCFL